MSWEASRPMAVKPKVGPLGGPSDLFLRRKRLMENFTSESKH